MLLVLAVLALVVVLQNTETVETHVLYFTVSMPKPLLLFLTSLVGLILVLLVYLRRKHGAGNGVMTGR